MLMKRRKIIADILCHWFLNASEPNSLSLEYKELRGGERKDEKKTKKLLFSTGVKAAAGRFKSYFF